MSRALAAPRFDFIDQPAKIIGAILPHINAYPDLVNVGLLYMLLRDVVFVWHFENRVPRNPLQGINAIAS